MRSRQYLGWLTVALGVLLAINSILGPLLTGVIDYHYSETINNQGIGLDSVALVIVAPIAVVSGLLILKGMKSGNLLAFAPATFASYMMPQYVIGPEYLELPGNNENFFVLHFATFILSGTVFVLDWNMIESAAIPGLTAARRRVAIGFLLLFPVFLVFGLYLASFADALDANPTRREYLDNPTAFWVVAFLDLAIAAPAAFASGIGLLRRAPWAPKALYAVVGWFALVPPSVAAMAITMVAKDDSYASAGKAAAFVAFAVVLGLFTSWLYLPLIRRDTVNHAVPGSTRESAHSGKASPRGV